MHCLVLLLFCYFQAICPYIPDDWLRRKDSSQTSSQTTMSTLLSDPNKLESKDPVCITCTVPGI